MRACPTTPQELVEVVKRVNRLRVPEFCGVESCARPHRASNLCQAHYQRYWKWARLNPQPKDEYPFERVVPALSVVSDGSVLCSHKGCVREFDARGLCRKHYLMWYKQEKKRV